jgi:site-specific DNA-adenine methylase
MTFTIIFCIIGFFIGLIGARLLLKYTNKDLLATYEELSQKVEDSQNRYKASEQELLNLENSYFNTRQKKKSCENSI